jgi:hypothetical protein
MDQLNKMYKYWKSLIISGKQTSDNKKKDQN